MGRKKSNNKKRIEDIDVYTTLIFSNDDIMITIKNVSLGMLELFTDKELIVKQFMYKMWFMHGMYDVITIEGIDYIILKRTKKNIELMVKDKISNVVGLNDESIEVDFEEVNSN